MRGRPAAPELAYSIVIPVRDEAESLEDLLRELAAAPGAGGAREILVVDDGSRDATPERLRELQLRGDPPLRILRHRQRLGQSAALRTGIAAARFEWVVTLDGDGQNDPADIPRLLHALAREGGSDLKLVCGWRRRRRDAWSRRAASRIANAVRGRVLGDGAPDAGCGLRLVHRATYLELPFFDHQHRFLPALVAAAGARSISVEVGHRPRRRGRSKYGLAGRLGAGFVDLAGVLWLRRRARRFEVEEIRAPDQSARRPIGERP